MFLVSKLASRSEMKSRLANGIAGFVYGFLCAGYFAERYKEQEEDESERRTYLECKYLFLGLAYDVRNIMTQRAPPVATAIASKPKPTLMPAEELHRKSKVSAFFQKVDSKLNDLDQKINSKFLAKKNDTPTSIRRKSGDTLVVTRRKSGQSLEESGSFPDNKSISSNRSSLTLGRSSIVLDER